MAFDRKQRIDVPAFDSARGTAQLELRTYKGSRELISSAHIHFVRDGMVTFELFGDFSKTLSRSPVRGTQANIDSQHARLFTPQAIDDLKAEAGTFYALKAEKNRAA